MDVVDVAQRQEDAYLADKLRAQRAAAALERAGAEICADCGDAIPDERRRALPSAIRCLDCQAFAERLGRA